MPSSVSSWRITLARLWWCFFTICMGVAQAGFLCAANKVRALHVWTWECRRMCVCPSVLIGSNASRRASVRCAGSGRTIVAFVRSCKWTKYAKWRFTWPLFLRSRAARRQSDLYGGRRIYLKPYLSQEVPFSSFQCDFPLTVGEGPVPPVPLSWWGWVLSGTFHIFRGLRKY